MDASISEEQKALMKRWVDTWKYVTGPELERIKKEELRALTEENALADTEMLLSSSVENWTPAWRQNSCGLVEQQEWFTKAKRRCE